MRTVFQVVATMVAANAAVALAADAKAATSKIKAGAAATAADAKAKASEVKAGAKTQATDAKAAAQEAAAAAAKKVEEQKAASAAPTAPAAAPAAPAAAEAKEAVKDAMAAQPKDSAELAGTTKSLIIPESAVLPESVLRFRAIYAGAKSEKGYDGAGNKVENGVKISANIGTAVLEYGITEKISAQLLIPYRLDGKAEVSDKETFITKAAAPGLIADPVAGPKLLGAKALVLQNPQLSGAYAINALTPTAIPLTGTGVTIPAGAKVKDFMDNEFIPQLALVQARANYDEIKKTKVDDTKFQKGLGDIEIGAKYALSTVKEPWFDGVPLYTSVAAGVRLDSSNYTEATKKGEIPVGRGTMDGAIRLNADYEFINGVQLQLENQSEIMLAKGKAWNKSEATGGKELDLERKGARQAGYSKLMVAPGTWIPSVDFLMLNARYSWNNESETKLGDAKTAGSVGRSAQLGVSFDGLKLKLPVQLDYDYVLAARGRSVTSAFDANVVTLKLFYKF
jgi:hypothetical protein